MTWSRQRHPDQIAGGVEVLRLPPISPNLNAFAERFVLSIRSECLDRSVPLSEAHLRRCVSEYLQHYHAERNHQGLGNEVIEGSPAPANTNGRVERRERLDGVLNFYAREAARVTSARFRHTTASP
jgi:putative transposase